METATAFSTAIVEQATRILEGIGIERPGAVIAPLVRSAIENALARTNPDAVDLSDFTSDANYPEDE